MQRMSAFTRFIGIPPLKWNLKEIEAKKNLHQVIGDEYLELYSTKANSLEWIIIIIFGYMN